MASASRRPGLRIEPLDLVDVLVYLTVLGLFVQFVPSILSESFLVSLATAVLLKIVLEIVVAAKKAVLRRRQSAVTARGRVLGTVLLLVVAAGSKFLVLWITDLVLGDLVHLGGFIEVTILIIALVLARTGVRALLGGGWSVVTPG